MDQLDDDLFDHSKYLRTGYYDRGRNSDRLLEVLLKGIPGDNYLPNNWKYLSYNNFIGSYGHLGVLLWATSASSHTLVLNGIKILRFWTDASLGCFVDGQPHVLKDPHRIPPQNGRKSAPFSYRMHVTTPEEVEELVNRVKQVYCLC